jgi:hypothetical protein
LLRVRTLFESGPVTVERSLVADREGDGPNSH